MSEVIRQFTKKAAQKYNKATVPSLTLNYPMPCGLTGEYPGLLLPVDSGEFAEATFRLQDALGLESDGKFGPGTWKAALEAYDLVLDVENYVVFNGRRIILPKTEAYTVINYDQEKDKIKPLELHSVGHFGPRGDMSLKQIVLHWGGLDPVHLHRVMSNPSRKVSTHFGIGFIGDDHTPVIFQYMDIVHKAYHAGVFNEGSIGIDICQQPSYKWIGEYQKRGYDVTKKENKTGRGNKNIITLDPIIAEATREFVYHLCDALNIPKKMPKSHDVISGDHHDFGIVGHHHLSDRKWDIACWWSDIF